MHAAAQRDATRRRGSRNTSTYELVRVSSRGFSFLFLSPRTFAQHPAPRLLVQTPSYSSLFLFPSLSWHRGHRRTRAATRSVHVHIPQLVDTGPVARYGESPVCLSVHIFQLKGNLGKLAPGFSTGSDLSRSGLVCGARDASRRARRKRERRFVSPCSPAWSARVEPSIPRRGSL